MIRLTNLVFIFIAHCALPSLRIASAFVAVHHQSFLARPWRDEPWRRFDSTSSSSSLSTENNNQEVSTTTLTIDSATEILAAWDRAYNNAEIMDKSSSTRPTDDDKQQQQLYNQLAAAVQYLNEAARTERDADSTLGRVMLGICAASAPQGIATLKSWVTALTLPRGLLHGMDKDGVPIDLDGSVYIKYNSGGVYTFEDIRKSGLGFDALWKPGDAMLEPYEGTYRGVYFQVELTDQVFRQFLVPLDVFDPIE